MEKKMKLAPDALIGIIEILRKGLVENTDISQLLKELDLVEDGAGKLRLSGANPTWLKPASS